MGDGNTDAGLSEYIWGGGLMGTSIRECLHNEFLRVFELMKRSRITLLNALANIKCCTFVFTNHPWNDNKLVIKPYVPWHLGPLTWQPTLENDYKRVEGNIQRRIDNRMVELKRENDLERRGMAIHDRERQFSPEVYEKRGFRGIIRLA
jgi:hypothetical protein